MSSIGEVEAFPKGLVSSSGEVVSHPKGQVSSIGKEAHGAHGGSVIVDVVSYPIIHTR